MSTEWTTVNRGNKNVSAVGTGTHGVRQTGMDKKTVHEKKRQQNRANWEAKRKAKIDEYDREFPLLPGSEDYTADSKKIAFIDACRAAKKEADKLAYLEREAKRELKRKKTAELNAIKEREHIKNMIEKWGAHRWFRMVPYTEDDCDTAKILRYEEEEMEYERERQLKEEERQWEEKWEKEQEQQKIADEKYCAEQTAGMTQREKELWIYNFEYERMLRDEDAREIEGDMMYRDFLLMEKQRKDDAERLALWEAKNKKN